MTGDVTINPTATCLEMTTEVRFSYLDYPSFSNAHRQILRSMFYLGSEIIREVA